MGTIVYDGEANPFSFELKIKEIDIELDVITTQLKSLLLEKEKLGLKRTRLVNFLEQDSEPQINEEVKPKKLKKTNDQPSKDDTEVQE